MGILVVRMERRDIQEHPHENSGCYVIIYILSAPTDDQDDRLGLLHFEPGAYAYVGSARRNLRKRVERHISLEKRDRWHIDYFSKKAAFQEAWCVYTEADLECELAQHLRASSQAEVKSFGCSDCRCTSHLLRFDQTTDFGTLCYEFSQDCHAELVVCKWGGHCRC